VLLHNWGAFAMEIWVTTNIEPNAVLMEQLLKNYLLYTSDFSWEFFH